MDINAILQMIHGNSAANTPSNGGGISLPSSAPMFVPSLQMPQFPGAGSNAGPQMAAQAAQHALSAQPQQQAQTGGMDPSQMGMFAMLQKMQGGGGDSGLTDLLGLNKPPTVNTSFTGASGSQLPLTISAPTPDLGSDAAGFHGLFHRIFGG